MSLASLFYDKLAPFVLSDIQLLENEYSIGREERRQVAVKLKDYGKRKQLIADDDGKTEDVVARILLLLAAAAAICAYHYQTATFTQTGRHCLIPDARVLWRHCLHFAFICVFEPQRRSIAA